MALFNRKPHGPLPADIVPLMEMYGRGEFDPRGIGVGRDVDLIRKGSVDSTLFPVAQADPDAFVSALADVILPLGGWAVYGASRLIWSLLGSGYTHPARDALYTAALQWLRDNGVPPICLSQNDRTFWMEHGGQTEPWLPFRVGYRPDDAPITDLLVGEARKLAQITPKPDSNVTYVYRNGDHEYVLIVEGPYSDEDPRRSQWVTARAETLRPLYTEAGAGLQMLPYWCDSEFEAFIPYDRPRIPIL